MPITLFYTGLLLLIFLVLSLRVIRGRQTKEVGLGHGGHTELERRIRGHANFAEYVPILLIGMALLENGGAPAILLHGLGIGLTVARAAHGYALAFSMNWPLGRMVGATLTLVALLVAGVAAVWQGAAAL